MAVLGLLVWRLSDIGWTELWDAAPTAPLFYISFLLFYLSLPLSEVVIYGRIWGRPLWRRTGVFLRKRVYNFGVLGYSGEAYFGLWARKALNLPPGAVFAAVKDVNILSALAANGVTLVLVAAFFASGQWAVVTAAQPELTPYLFAVGVIGVALTLGGLALQRFWLSMERVQALEVFGWHVVRLVLGFAFQIGQWASATPEVPLSTWLIFLTALMLISRAPFLPNKDLVFLSVGLVLAGGVAAPEVEVAAMLTVSAALAQIANVVVYFATVFSSRVPEGDPPRKASSHG
ncbi:MAG: hypothetical protein ACFB2Z_06735 [Maricaulaceae bacterium]